MNARMAWHLELGAVKLGKRGPKVVGETGRVAAVCGSRPGEVGIAERIGEAAQPGVGSPDEAASGFRGTGLVLFLTNLLAITLAG